MTLILALNYSGKWDLIQATQHIAAQVLDGTLDPESINEALIQNNLSTHGIPDPELLIRTSGERRLSNFLLWQLAYSELFFSPVFGRISVRNTSTRLFWISNIANAASARSANNWSNKPDHS